MGCTKVASKRRFHRVPVFLLLLLTIGISCAPGGLGGPGSKTPEESEPSLPTDQTGQPSAPSVASPTTATAAPRELTEALSQLWGRTPKGCLVVESAGSILYEAGGGSAFEPASVIKILTARAGLEALGETMRFRTVVAASSRPSEGTIRGDLWLVGSGDPVLATNSWAANYTRGQPYTSLDQLADRVAAAGIRRVDGNVIGDESRYDSLRYVESWPNRFITDGEIGPLSALAVNDGFSTWGHPGVRFENPPVDAAAIFKALLEARGIRITGEAMSGKANPNTVEVASIQSSELANIASAMLRESDNGTAEMLIKEIGLRRLGTGSTSNGTKAATRIFSEKGHPVAGLSLSDGSGLSPLNRVSCRLLTSILRDASPSLAAGLPVAAQTGTLSRRFVGSPVAGKLRAKTGSLDGIAALAGYADNRAGQTLTFAYLANGLPKTTSARSLQDFLANVLATDKGAHGLG